MTTQTDAQHGHHEPPEGKKVTLTISTLEGDWTHDFPAHDKLQVLVDQTIEHLDIKDEGPWILEFKGRKLPLHETIEQAKLKDNDILTLCPEEAGGASAGQ